MYKNKSVIGWALYDWANSVFVTVVIAGFFPIVFKSYWASELPSSESTFWLGLGNALASLVVVIIAPLLGAAGDKYHLRKPMLLGLMLIGVITTAALSQQSALAHWQTVLALYVIASIGFMAANVFYDALLVPLSATAQVDKVSGLGYGMGYLGGGISLAACVYLSQQPQLLGYTDSIDAVLFCFILVAVWWFVFSLPLAMWTKDGPRLQNAENSSVFVTTLRAFKMAFSNREVRLFLIAYWIYIDGVDTIIRMAVDYGMALGFESNDLIIALLITQFVGFPAAIIYGYIGAKVGVKASIMAGIGVYALITLLGYSMTTVADFYTLAVLIGLVQGGVQAMSRSFYARMVPVDKSAEYFGIYNMLGKSAAIIGPLLMGLVALITDNHRYSILSLLLLFVLGALLLSRVNDPQQKVSATGE